MRLPILVATLMLAAGLLPGQEKPEALEAAIIPVKTLSGNSFNRLANLLKVFGAKYEADDKLRTIVVYAPPDVIAKMRRVIEQLDQPGSEAAIGRNIEMTLAFLRCSITAPADARPLPADLEPVAKQLRAITQYKNVQLWDIVPLHLQEGKRAEHTLRLPLAPVPNAAPAANTAIISMWPEAVTRKDSGRYVRFERLEVNLMLPQGGGTQRVGLQTGGEFKEGQKTVLGKVSALDDESAIFVVISLKVLD